MPKQSERQRVAAEIDAVIDGYRTEVARIQALMAALVDMRDRLSSDPARKAKTKAATVPHAE